VTVAEALPIRRVGVMEISGGDLKIKFPKRVPCERR
jgi:hypothetical protein